ncbi:MAG: thiamine pyrophosphate-dependent enzyme [Bryobacteraceae bacterium]
MPDFGTNVTELKISRWLVEVGTPVHRGTILAEIETDKVTMELECIADGVLLERCIKDGEMVEAGRIIAHVGAPEALAGAVAAPAVAPTTARLRPGSVEFLLDLYRRMLLIRHFEERVKYLFLEGVMPGTIHQCQGQEAIAVGVCAALGPADVITSTHRPHGHAIAKGLTVKSLMHELFGKPTGCCRGKGGSMHVGDPAKGMIPAIAIVGGGVPVATGMALAFRMKKEPRVAVCFMGDGAVNEGAFHEGVNMGAIWSLPVVYVIENNRYSASTPIAKTVRLKNLAERAAGYGIPGVTVDGNDVLAVYETARAAVGQARCGGGPTLIEAVTYRITGHSRRDPCNYQPEEERKKALAAEPIGRFAAHLMADGVVDQAELDRIRAEVDAEIERAVESAIAAPDPRPEDALEDVYA